MTTTTPNLSLVLYNSTTDQAEYFSNFRATIAGVSTSSNFYKIDTAYGTQASQISSLQNTRGAIYVPATYVSANYYESSSVTEITAYTTNMTIILRLDVASAGTVTLNINSLGTKTVSKINSSGSVVNIAAGELMVGKNYLFRYDGTQWIWVNANSIDQLYAAGTSGNFLRVSSSNTVEDSGSSPSTFAPSAKGVTNGDSHDHVGGDGAAITEAAITLDDNTTNDVSTSRHGFVPKAPNDSAKFLGGSGAWGVPYGILYGYVRCSLLSGDPNPIADQSAKTSLYIMNFLGNTLPSWNGSEFFPMAFTELTVSLNATYQTSPNLYDVYVFKDSGTIYGGFGVAWSSSTSRGTGAGTAEIEEVNGIKVNKNSMTMRNGASSYTVPARYGTKVATVSISTSGQLNWTSSFCEISNEFNPMEKTLTCKDSTNNWTYTIATWRAANANTTNGVGRVGFVLSSQRHVRAFNHSYVYTSGATPLVSAGIGIDSTSANSAQIHGGFSPLTVGAPTSAEYDGEIGIGLHYVQRLEISAASGTTFWSGDEGSSFVECGMNVIILA